MKGLDAGRRKIGLIDFSIRTKLIIIYLLCVIVPIIVFSIIFYSSVTRSTRNEKLMLYNQAIDRIAGEIESNAVSAIQIANIIYSDEMMYRYLNNTYLSEEAYLDDYDKFFKDAWSQILPYNTNIIFLAAYTDNDTILSTNYIHKLGDNHPGNWYKEFLNKPEHTHFITHIDPVKVGNNGSRLVSLVRRLDYVKSSQYSHLLRITFREDTFERALRGENLPGTLYLVDQNHLIIARSDQYSNRYNNLEFETLDHISVGPDQVIINKKIPVMDNWQVVCMLDKDFLKADYRNTRKQIFFLMFFVTIFASVVIWSISASFYTRIHKLVGHMEKVEKEKYELIPESRKGNDEIGLLFTSMNKMISKIKILIEDVYKAKIRETQLELSKKQSELNALQWQVNPHFMFNVLETIRIKSYMNHEFETARIIQYMSRIFRKLLQWEEDLIELREELKFIQEYLEIQQYRYEDELVFEIHADESVLDVKIPKMTLQTFVDNACEHGFSEAKEVKKIKITAVRSGNWITLSVYDNGIGMNPELVENIENYESNGVGINNVIGRLNLYFEGKYRFHINSRPREFTEIVLVLDLER